MELIQGMAYMKETDARMLNPLQLAYVGDTVWDLLVRTRILAAGWNVKNMNRLAIAQVNAGAQSAALDRVRDMLTEEEATLVRRGRNTTSNHPTPKNQSPENYQAATGLEALMGYLYLTGHHQRLLEIWEKARTEQ